MRPESISNPASAGCNSGRARVLARREPRVPTPEITSRRVMVTTYWASVTTDREDAIPPPVPQREPPHKWCPRGVVRVDTVYT